MTSLNCNPSSACGEPEQRGLSPIFIFFFFADGFKWVRKRVSLQQLREQSVAIGKVQLRQEREIECRLPGGTDPGSDDCSKPLCALQNAFVDSFHEWGCKVFQYLENYKHSLLFCTRWALSRYTHEHGQSFTVVTMETSLLEEQTKPRAYLRYTVVSVKRAMTCIQSL